MVKVLVQQRHKLLSTILDCKGDCMFPGFLLLLGIKAVVFLLWIPAPHRQLLPVLMTQWQRGGPCTVILLLFLGFFFFTSVTQNFLGSPLKTKINKQANKNSLVNGFIRITISFWPPTISPDVCRWLCLDLSVDHLLWIKHSSCSRAYGFLIVLVYCGNERLPLN